MSAVRGRRRSIRRGLGAALAPVAAAACTGPQRVLDTAGPAAERIAGLWWVMFALASLVSVVVGVLLLVAIRRALGRERGDPSAEVNGRALVWTGGVAVPVVVLLAVLVLSFRAGIAVYPPPSGEEGATVIEVIGHQYWWEVTYPEHGVTTANEIHLPVGEPVVFRVSAPDVIHSFWIPQLQGKMDMIPGQTHTLYVVAEEPGRFRGQCAEFCGDGHALMAFWVVALEPAEFDRWIEAAAAAARATPEPPSSPLARRGREIFRHSGCGDCHTTPGAPLPAVVGRPGPDLSTLARRSSLAAGTLPNTTAALRRWIEEPDAVKPGSSMPATPLPEREMDALIAYLVTLR